MLRPARLFAFLLALPICAAAQGVKNMIDVDPDSRSLILRATHIVAARVVSADDPQWLPVANMGEERVVSLQLALEQVLKGRVRQRPGDSIRIQAKQRRVGMSWRPLPGVWSNVPVAPGTRLVAFSRMEGDDAAAALNDPAALQLIPAADALDDVQVVARVAAGGMGLRALLAAAAAVDGTLGSLFADYLWARFQAEAMANFAAFDSIVEFMERRSLNRVARATLLMSIPDAVLAPEPPPADHVDRFAVAMFRLLDMPEAAALHENIVGTYLPNLLGLSEPDPRPAGAVFKNYPQDRSRAARALSPYSRQSSASLLAEWLRR
jgi:hypothetical protein